MKDRLEDIYIRRSYSLTGEGQHEKIDLQFQRLYDNLYQFNILVDAKVVIDAGDGIQFLEHIVESCRSLKNIEISYKFSASQPHHTLPISKYIPRPSIESLKVFMNEERNDHNLLRYIMHKFPRLKHLTLYLREDDPLSDILLFPQLYEYLFTIDNSFVSHLSTNQSNLMEVVGNTWEKAAKPGSQSLLIVYPDEFYDNIKTGLQIARKSGEGIRTKLEYPVHTGFDWISFMDFIRKKGKYVGTISFDFTLEYRRLDKKIPENFFYDTLTNCPNLENLYFTGCSFRSSLHTATRFDNKFSINELSFIFCSIEPGRLLQLSSLLYKVNRLRIFCGLIHNPGNGPDDGSLIINMPHTRINRIAFEVKGFRD